MSLNKSPSVQEHICLYFYPGTRAFRAQWILEELTLEYEVFALDLKQGEHKSDEYLLIHPLGKVPALKIGERFVFESLAICLYLADHYPQAALAPATDSPERAEYYQWMAFSTGTLEPVIIEQMRYQRAQESGVEVIDLGPVLTSFNDAMAYINHKLMNKKFLIGERFSAADVMVGSMLMWADSLGMLADFEPLRSWVESIKQRPAYQRIQTQ